MRSRYCSNELPGMSAPAWWAAHLVSSAQSQVCGLGSLTSTSAPKMYWSPTCASAWSSMCCTEPVPPGWFATDPVADAGAGAGAAATIGATAGCTGRTGTGAGPVPAFMSSGFVP